MAVSVPDRPGRMGWELRELVKLTAGVALTAAAVRFVWRRYALPQAKSVQPPPAAKKQEKAAGAEDSGTSSASSRLHPPEGVRRNRVGSGRKFD